MGGSLFAVSDLHVPYPENSEIVDGLRAGCALMRSREPSRKYSAQSQHAEAHLRAVRRPYFLPAGLAAGLAAAPRG